MAGQKQMAAKMADEYVLKIPSVTFPEDSPEWVTTVFPALIKSIYETFNGMVKKMVSDFNDSFPISVRQRKMANFYFLIFLTQI